MDCPPRLLLPDLSRRTLRAFFATYGELGFGFPEAICAAGLAVVLREQGLRYARHPRIEVRFRGGVIGAMQPDFIVEDAIIVELKATRDIEGWQQAQMLKYLRATDHEVGLLLNFGRRPEFKRFIYTNDRKHGRRR